MFGRTTMTLHPGMTRLNENAVPNVKNTSFTVACRLDLPAEPADGVLVAQGGGFGGWTLYLDAGTPVYVHNFVGLESFTVRGDRALGPGEQVLVLRFDYDGGGAGRGGDVRFLLDGAEVGKGRVERTVPALFSFDEGLDVGLDSLDPVVPDYPTAQGRSTGTIRDVVIDVAPDPEHDPDLVVRARYRKQ